MSEPGREQFIELLEPVVTRLGFELADIEAQFGTKSGVLRLFIDKPDGITLEDCELVSRQVSAVLDVEDPISGDFNLEVSSPGLNRRLVKPEHFERFAGQQVKVKLRKAIDQRRNFKATLLGHESDNVLLDEDGTQFAIALKDIDTARLVPDF